MVLINGSGKVEKFEIQGFHTHDIVMDDGNADFADLLAEYEGENVTVIVVAQEDANRSLMSHIEKLGENAVELSERITELVERLERVNEEVENGTTKPIEAIRIVTEVTARNIQLRMIMNELQAYFDLGVSG